MQKDIGAKIPAYLEWIQVTLAGVNVKKGGE